MTSSLIYWLMSAQLMHLIKMIKYCWSYVKSLLWYGLSSALIRLTRITGTKCITRQTHFWNAKACLIFKIIFPVVMSMVSFGFIFAWKPSKNVPCWPLFNRRLESYDLKYLRSHWMNDTKVQSQGHSIFFCFHKKYLITQCWRLLKFKGFQYTWLKTMDYWNSSEKLLERYWWISYSE